MTMILNILDLSFFFVKKAKANSPSIFTIENAEISVRVYLSVSFGERVMPRKNKIAYVKQCIVARRRKKFIFLTL